MPSIWWTRRAVALHATLLVCEPGFAALCWWQVHRALGGNSLSWMYVFEWPFFGAYAVVLWWRIVHDQPGRARPGQRGKAARENPGTPAPARAAGLPGSRLLLTNPWWARRAARRAADAAQRQQIDEQRLAAYNRYLASLRAGASSEAGAAAPGAAAPGAAATGLHER